MPNNDLRGKKEMINGKVIDQQGIHLDESFIEKTLIQASLGNSGQTGGYETSEDDVVDLEGDFEEIDGNLVDKNGMHLNKDSLFESLSSSLSDGKLSKNSHPKKETNNKGKSDKISANIDLGIYQPVLEELNKVPFSSDFENEIKIFVNAVKEASKDLKIKKIVSNTKAIAKNAQKFYHSSDGMRVVFSILGNKFSMSANGEFMGNEAFFIQVNGDSLDGIVLRKDDNGDYADVTDSYKVAIKKEK